MTTLVDDKIATLKKAQNDMAELFSQKQGALSQFNENTLVKSVRRVRFLLLPLIPPTLLVSPSSQCTFLSFVTHMSLRSNASNAPYPYLSFCFILI
jgi:hypothetical protein